jgi:hypothetical protein
MRHLSHANAAHATSFYIACTSNASPTPFTAQPIPEIAGRPVLLYRPIPEIVDGAAQPPVPVASGRREMRAHAIVRRMN